MISYVKLWNHMSDIWFHRVPSRCWGSHHSNYSQLFPFISSTNLPVLTNFLAVPWCTFYDLNCLYGVQARKWRTMSNHSRLFPWFCSCGDSIKLIISLIIPNDSFDYSWLFSQLKQVQSSFIRKSTIASKSNRLQRSKRPLPFTILH